MSHFPNMENHLQSDINSEYTSAEQLLASVGETPLQGDSISTGPFSSVAHPSTTNNWNYGIEGLQDPLRRPDPNQMPPDVLSLLLKNGQFTEILNPQFGSNLTGSPQNRQGSNWTPNTFNPNQQFSAQPQNFSQAPSIVPSGYAEVPCGNTTPFQSPRFQQSNLSPFAAEFVPKQFSPQGQVENSQMDLLMLTQAIAQISQNSNYETQQFNPSSFTQQTDYVPRQPMMQQQFAPRPRGPPSRNQRQQFTQRNSISNSSRAPRQPQPDIPFDFETNADRVLTFVVDTISYLTRDPANFNSSIKKMMKVLRESLTDADTLEIMVTLIIEQSVANRNFFTTGARMCETLNDNRVKAGQLTAQKCTISRAQEVFQAEFHAVPANHERLIGLLLFLGELFVRFKVDGKQFFGFGVALCEVVTKLITSKPGQMPKHEDIRVVLNVLKLAGWELDQCTNATLKPYLETMFTRLSHVLSLPDLPSNTNALVEQIFEIRKRNWGRGELERAAGTPGEEARPATPPSTVTYGGKEQENVYEVPSSDEEADLYLDEEAEKCFDQFLNENQSQH